MEVPQHVGEVEYTTPARVPAHRRSKGGRSQGGRGGRSRRGARADSPSTPSPSSTPPPTQPASTPPPPAVLPVPRSLTTPESALRSLISGDDENGEVSTVVRDAIDNLLLNVVKQLQHDLLHGPAQTRSKIASQFLPRIMRLLDKEDAEDQTQLEELREEMERLNHELLHGDPVLYTPLSTATPDDTDLPIVDPTGVTVEQRRAE